MNRMKILKNPDLPAVFSPVEPMIPPVETVDVTPLNDLLPHRLFESLRGGGITWSTFIQNFDIRYQKKTVYDKVMSDSLSCLFSNIENPAEVDYMVSFLLMSPVTFSDLRAWGNEAMIINNDLSLIMRGEMGFIWGAMILVCRQVPKNLILACADSNECIGATLELGQETFAEAGKLVELEKDIQRMSQELNSKYRRMIDIIHSTVHKIENKDTH